MKELIDSAGVVICRCLQVNNHPGKAINTTMDDNSPPMVSQNNQTISAAYHVTSNLLCLECQLGIQYTDNITMMIGSLPSATIC